jgi:hypothetical protein
LGKTALEDRKIKWTREEVTSNDEWNHALANRGSTTQSLKKAATNKKAVDRIHAVRQGAEKYPVRAVFFRKAELEIYYSIIDGLHIV